MIFVTPTFLAATLRLGSGIKQKWAIPHLKYLASAHPVGLIIYFQENISCIGAIAYLVIINSRNGVDLPTYWFLLISPQTLDS